MIDTVLFNGSLIVTIKASDVSGLDRFSLITGMAAIDPNGDRRALTNIELESLPFVEGEPLAMEGDWVLKMQADTNPANGTWSLVALATVSDRVGNTLETELAIETFEVNIT